MPLLEEEKHLQKRKINCQYCGLPLEAIRQYYFSSEHAIDGMIYYCNNLICPGESRGVE